MTPSDLIDSEAAHAANLERFPLRKAIFVRHGGDYDYEALLFADEFKNVYRCPNCLHTATLEFFDAAGADDGCVFCPKCSEELRLA